MGKEGGALDDMSLHRCPGETRETRVSACRKGARWNRNRHLPTWDDDVLPRVELLRQRAVSLGREEDALLDVLLPVLIRRGYKSIAEPMYQLNR